MARQLKLMVEMYRGIGKTSWRRKDRKKTFRICLYRGVDYSHICTKCVTFGVGEWGEDFAYDESFRGILWATICLWPSSVHIYRSDTCLRIDMGTSNYRAEEPRYADRFTKNMIMNFTGPQPIRAKWCECGGPEEEEEVGGIQPESE